MSYYLVEFADNARAAKVIQADTWHAHEDSSIEFRTDGVRTFYAQPGVIATVEKVEGPA